MCPCCFHDFCTTEAGQWVCNCLPTQRLMEECRRLQESMLAIEAGGEGQQPLLPQPPPPSTNPPSGQAGYNNKSSNWGASGMAPASASRPASRGRVGSASTASTMVEDPLPQVLAELRALKALVLRVEAKVDAVEAKVDALNRPSESDPSGKHQNSTAALYNV